MEEWRNGRLELWKNGIMERNLNRLADISIIPKFHHSNYSPIPF